MECLTVMTEISYIFVFQYYQEMANDSTRLIQPDFRLDQKIW